MIRVAIAEDHAEMRVALRLLVKLSSNLELVGEVSDGLAAVDCVKKIQPDVLVMDIQMPVLDGLSATRQILEQEAPPQVILISANGGKSVIMDVIAAGAKGFIHKDHLAPVLLEAIEAVHQGETFFR